MSKDVRFQLRHRARPGRALTALVMACVGLAAVGCGSSYFPPQRPETHIDRDLAAAPTALADLGCFNTACNACSEVARWDGTPAQPGDPCLHHGLLQCTAGNQLVCSTNACLACSTGTPDGSVCGADGHTIVSLVYPNGTCQAWDLNSTVAVCNGGPNDRCVQRCVKDGSAYHCSAWCAASDAGATGCQYDVNATCESLTGC